MTKYYAVDKDGNIIQVPFSYKFGEALIETFKVGLDEGVIGWSSSWQDLDLDDVKTFLNDKDPTAFTTVMNSIRESVRELIVENLKNDDQ
jgi:hypothetical protein